MPGFELRERGLLIRGETVGLVACPLPTRSLVLHSSSPLQ
jgi:hypothetical protein